MIRDFDHATALLNAGDLEASDARTSQEAIYAQAAFESRLSALGDCTTPSAIDEGKWLCSQLDALACDFGDGPSPECEWHLY